MSRSMLGKPWAALFGCAILSATTLTAAGEKKMSEKKGVEPWADLPVPRLGVRYEDLRPIAGYSSSLVWAHVPEIPGCVLDLVCYEHNPMLDYRKLEGGALELRHRARENPNVLLFTTVKPEPGAVELVARAEVDRERDPEGKLPDEMPKPNLCFRVKRAEGCFSHFPDPFPEFISRCFIFTDKGRTFLTDTVRRRLPRIADKPDDPRNNPPWIQIYVGVWRPVPKPSTGNTWYTASPDRFTIPVMGVVSRDGKYLTAIANGSADSMCQAWQQCLHNNPKWLPEDAPPEQRRWRVKIYIMPNDPDMLLKRVLRDFPEAAKLKEKRIPAER